MNCSIKKKKSLKDALNNIGPNTEPLKSLKSLLILLIRTYCFLLSKYEFIYFSNFLYKP